MKFIILDSCLRENKALKLLHEIKLTERYSSIVAITTLSATVTQESLEAKVKPALEENDGKALLIFGALDQCSHENLTEIVKFANSNGKSANYPADFDADVMLLSYNGHIDSISSEIPIIKHSENLAQIISEAFDK